MTDNLSQSRSDMVRLNRELEAKISQLERTQAQLVQSEKLASIGEMAAAVAHGLRNPLASLRAAAQVVRHHPESPSSGEHLDAIIEEVDRLDRRISHLLSFSRPAPFRPTSESVSRLVEGLLPTFSEQLRERGVTLEVEIPPTLPEVRVDPMQVEQALVELVSNALDAMPAGGRLRIGARAERSRRPAARSPSKSPIPAQGYRTTCFRRSANRSSLLAPMAPDSVSRSPNVTSSRTGAGSRSRAGRVPPQFGCDFRPPPLLRQECRHERSDRAHR